MSKRSKARKAKRMAARALQDAQTMAEARDVAKIVGRVRKQEGKTSMLDMPEVLSGLKLEPTDEEAVAADEKWKGVRERGSRISREDSPWDVARRLVGKEGFVEPRGPVSPDVDRMIGGGVMSKDLHKRILQMYFGLLARVQGCAEGVFARVALGDDADLEDSPSSRASAWRCFKALRQATIVEVTVAQYFAVYEAAARDSTEEAGVKFTNDPDDIPPDREIEQYMAFMDGSVARRKPHPTRLPFETTFFAVDPWCAMPPLVRGLWFGQASRWAVPFGMLVTRDEVFELSLGDNRENSETDPTLLLVWSAYRSASVGGRGQWTFPLGLAPWITTSLVTMVNGVGNLLLQKPRSVWSSERARKARRVMKLDQLPPPAYYCVEIKPTTTTESRMDSRFPALVVERDYQWLCRGNEKRRLMRGSLTELTPELEKWLLKRRAGGQRYHIVRAGQVIDPVTAEVLAYKNQPPPRPGELVAALRWWQSSHARGPKDKPLRTSTRRVRGEGGLRGLKKAAQR